MLQKPVIAIAGATGAQGGGLLRAMRNDPAGPFRARALTRDPDTPRAQALAAAGVEVVAADVDDQASLERAFTGAHGAFCVTFLSHQPERETAQAAAMAAAARRAGVQHVVWSTLEDTRKFVPLTDNRIPTLMERYKVPHFDAKGAADLIFRELKVPTTFLLTSFYWDNFINFGLGPRKGPDGVAAITFPMGDAKMPGIASQDIGACAYRIFQQGGDFIGKTVGIAGEHLTLAQMAAAFGRALNQEVRYHDVPVEVFRSFGFPNAADLTNMFQFMRDFADPFCAARSVAFTRGLYPGLQTFDTWLSANLARLPRP